MKTVGIIIAKGNSKRFPGKNFYPVNGKPMFLNNALLLKNSDFVDDVYVATDSKIIKKICEENEIKIINRGENISEDEQPFFEVLKFAYQSIATRYDLIITVLANAIGHEQHNIDHALEKIISDSEIKELRSFDDNGNQSGIFVFRDYLFHIPHTLAHMGMIKSNGKEIHFKGELK